MMESMRALKDLEFSVCTVKTKDGKEFWGNMSIKSPDAIVVATTTDEVLICIEDISWVMRKN